MDSQILKHLLRAYAERNDQEFRKAALQLAARESQIGHVKLAQELRAIISRLPTERLVTAPSTVEICKPRGELADLIEGGFRSEKLTDIVLDPEAKREIQRVIQENRQRATLANWGVEAKRRLLFFGPPGCGKTLAARVVSGELGLPLLTVRFDALFSRYLGATANHLRAIFDEMPRRPGVYFFDEFDAIGKHRGESLEVGEIRRVVSSFLQLLDADRSRSLIIAATNFHQAVDPAVVRRFDLVLNFWLPNHQEASNLAVLRLSQHCKDLRPIKEALTAFKGLSFADIARACDDTIRSMALEERSWLTVSDFLAHVEAEKKRKYHLNECATVRSRHARRGKKAKANKR